MADSPDAPHSRHSLGRAVLYGCLAGLSLSFGLHAAYVLLGPNFHTVLPGLVYRSAQPSGPRLAQLVRTKGIRTVLNLRGCCDPLPQYAEEARWTNRLNISQEDISFSAGRLPSVVALRQLLEALDRSEYPILFHCHKGSDRTGLASAVALLLKSDASLAEARRQVGWRYGHLPLGRTTHIDRFFDLYAEWLQAHGLTHSPTVFRHWAAAEYCPDACRCRLELLDHPEPLLRVPLRRPFPIHVRCWNTSIQPWRLHPSNEAGFHLGFWIFNDRHQLVANGRAGLFHKVVPPGEHIDLTIAVPALERGDYDLRASMMEEQHAFFVQMGSEPLFCKLEVR